jgi:predicted nucleic acid-binding protein
VIHLDTSLMVDALSGRRQSASAMRAVAEAGERMALSTLVLYEWLRGPRRSEEIEAQAALFPVASAVQFGADEAALAANLYRALRRPRGREVDLAIAACALTHDAMLWTLNPADFADVPGLALFRPSRV